MLCVLHGSGEMCAAFGGQSAFRPCCWRGNLRPHVRDKRGLRCNDTDLLVKHQFDAGQRQMGSGIQETDEGARMASRSAGTRHAVPLDRWPHGTATKACRR